MKCFCKHHQPWFKCGACEIERQYEADKIARWYLDMATGNWTEADVLAHNAKLGKRRRMNTLMDVNATSLKVFEAMLDHPVPVKKSKYRNIRCEVDGEKFDSKAEAEFWLELKQRERLGEIRDLRRQVPFPLLCPAELGTVHLEVARYIADFVWTDGTTGRQVVADKKGHRTREYLLKRKWMALQYGIEILEV